MLVNIGCGAVAHPSWLNLDMAPQHPLAVVCDLRSGLPLASASSNATYSSHVIEHLSPSESSPFIKEQFRVLKPGGVLRVVVPDLEAICHLYLRHLAALRQGDRQSDFPYRFTLLELFDQVARDRTGGDLLACYKAAAPNEAAYIIERHGDEARRHLPALVAVGGAGHSGVARPQQDMTRRLADKLARYRQRVTLLVARAVGGAAAEHELRIGRFRVSGEVHRTMYDSHSLSQLLLQHGFEDVQVVTPWKSRIPRFAEFELDAHGQQARKPDSLFVEAVKPGA